MRKNNLPLIIIVIFVISGTAGLLPRFLQVSFDEGVEMLRQRDYKINEYAKWTEYQAAGFKLTETKLNGFLQICERLRADLGAVTVCLDLEARIAIIYDPSVPAEEREIFYLKFPF